MKWIKGANEGIVVAGGQSEGTGLAQLSYPRGVVVDKLGTIYVTDNGHRATCWTKGATAGSVVAGGNGVGTETNQLSSPWGLSFDHQGNLYVADSSNNRVQKFYIEPNSNS